MGETFFAALRRHADAQPDRPAVTVGDETLTRAELVRTTQNLAETFRAQGVGHGDFVTIVLPNSIEFVQACWAAWLLGATPAPVSDRLPTVERDAIVELAAAKVVVDDREAVRAAASADVEPGPEGEMSPEWKVLTSGGSTGRPKLIVASTPADAEVASGLGTLLRVQADGCIIETGPMSHNAPFVVMTLGLVLGNHVVIMPRFDAAESLRLVQEHRADFLYLVPTMMQRIWRLDEAERRAYDVSSLRVAFHMAAPCPPWLKQAWIDWLGPETILELYGGTELQALTVITGTEWLEHRGSVGRPVIGEIVERDGELWMRRGADEPAAYRYVGATAKEQDGWESLGDLGYLDEDGYVYISDRDTDMILVGGQNVYPAEVEAAIEEHPAVLSSCVIGLPHEDLGSVPHAIVQGEVADDELTAHLTERLARYKIPRSFERASEPLRDDAGKVRRSALRAARL